jgi:hypothetical protein
VVEHTGIWLRDYREQDSDWKRAWEKGPLWGGRKVPWEFCRRCVCGGLGEQKPPNAGNRCLTVVQVKELPATWPLQTPAWAGRAHPSTTAGKWGAGVHKVLAADAPRCPGVCCR